MIKIFKRTFNGRTTDINFADIIMDISKISQITFDQITSNKVYAHKNMIFYWSWWHANRSLDAEEREKTFN